MRGKSTSLIVLVLALFLLPDVGFARRDAARDTVEISGNPRGFHGKTVEVIDHFGHAEWSAEAAAQISHLNERLPQNAPEFVLRAENTPCTTVAGDAQWIARGTVVLCAFDPAEGSASGYGWASAPNGDEIRRAGVGIATNTTMGDFPKVLCHELMHAIAGLNHEDMPDNEGSCFSGPLSHMGPTDFAVFESIYADHEKDKDKRNGKHKKHHKH